MSRRKPAPGAIPGGRRFADRDVRQFKGSRTIFRVETRGGCPTRTLAKIVMTRIAGRKHKQSEGTARYGRGAGPATKKAPAKRAVGAERSQRPTALGPAATAETETDSGPLTIRPVEAGDMTRVIALDERITGLAKPDYWQDVFERYSSRRQSERFFLVAAGALNGDGSQILGFIIGEIRVWEFGSAPCGWVFALSVEPDARLHGVGQALFDAISTEFKKAGVTNMRTMVARDNQLHLLFFRGEGMMAGPYIQLEKELT